MAVEVVVATLVLAELVLAVPAEICRRCPMCRRLASDNELRVCRRCVVVLYLAAIDDRESPACTV